MSGINVIRRWVIQSRLKEQTKQGGVMITLPPKNFVDLNTSITADRLLRSGIDIDQLTSVAQVENLVNRINKLSTRVISQDDPRFKGIMESLMGKRGEVVDMTGKKIPPGSKIMGGQAVEDQKRFFKGVEIKDPKFDENMPFDSDAEKLAEIKMSNEAYDDFDLEKGLNDLDEFNVTKDAARAKQLIDDQPPPGSRGGKDDIAAPVQSAKESTTNLMDSTIQKMLKMKPINAMKEANKVIKREGIYKALNQKQAKKILEDTEDHIFERDFKTPDDPDFDPEKMATGGIARIGLKDGMNRRTFLKLLGGAISLPIIGRFFKPAKGVGKVSKTPIIKTPDIKGKPEWFDSLVNRVIMEGDDVTKKLATKDREVVHTKKLNDTDEVTVYQDLETDSIRVEYKSPDNMLEEPVDLMYKRTPPDESVPKGSAEFEASEMGFVSRQDGPDDYFIDAEPTGGSTIKDLDSDVSVLKEYATGKGPTMKEFVQKKKRKDKVKKLNEGDLEAQSQYIIDRQGDYYDYDDYAKGGLAGMLGE